MRTILFIIQKEFLQIFRNKAMLPLIFVLPFIQLLILSNAATFEMKVAKMHLIDRDQSNMSRLLVTKFTASGRFKVVNSSYADSTGIEDLEWNKANFILNIPRYFERDLKATGKAKIQMVVDAVDGYSAGLIQSYSGSILSSMNQEIQMEVLDNSTAAARSIQVLPSNWYNPLLNYKTYMVPGILVTLVTMIGSFLAGMNIVREKELGTIEQLNVTPIHKYEFIIGKLLPFLIIGLFELSFGLTLAHVVFNVPILGSIPLIFGIAIVYLLGVLGLGLLVSTLADTQQQAMFISWFFTIVFMLMSGLFTPIDSMPGWAKAMTLVNPIAHFIKIMRQVMLKGAGFEAVQSQFWALVAFAVIMLTLAVSRYRKASA